MSDSDNLGAFFGTVRGAGAGTRLFSWKKICDAASVAEAEYADLVERLAQTEKKLGETESLATSREAIIDGLNTRISEMTSKYEARNADADRLSKEKSLLEGKLAGLTVTAAEHERSAGKWKAAESTCRTELAALQSQFEELSRERDALAGDLATERSAHLADNEQARTFREQYLSREAEIDALRRELDAAGKEIAARQAEIDSYIEERDTKYAVLAAEAERLSALSSKLAEERKAEEEEAEQRMQEIFAEHHDRVGELLERVCSELHLDLRTAETYRGEGSPEFAVLVNSSYVFFNTAAPASSAEAEEFASRVSGEAELLFEAAKEDGVRGEAYLVVPNTVAAQLAELVFSSERCTVFVVTPEAVEPIVRTLQRIEEYEFARQITPFELDQICRFVGELSHMTKRKIVLDTYFSNEMLEILQKTENLPTDVVADVTAYENAVRLNPPAERDATVLTVPSLSAKVQKLEKAMLARAAAEAEEEVADTQPAKE